MGEIYAGVTRALSTLQWHQMLKELIAWVERYSVFCYYFNGMV